MCVCVCVYFLKNRFLQYIFINKKYYIKIQKVHSYILLNNLITIYKKKLLNSIPTQLKLIS
jgi:hypothetical protein